MNPALAGALVKARRAQYHLETIDEELTRVVGVDSYRIATEPNADRTQYVCKVEGLRELRPDLSAIAGDFIHNLRSALDYLAWGLVIANGNTPTRWTTFPIATRRPKNGLRVAGDPDPAAMTVVESVQPYANGDGNAHPLASLHELNIIDKHHELLFMRTVIGQSAWGLPGDMPSPRLQVRSAPLEDGDEVARFSFDAPYPSLPEPEFEPGFELAVRLDPRVGFSGTIARHTLDGLFATTLWNVRDWIIPKFIPFL